MVLIKWEPTTHDRGTRFIREFHSVRLKYVRGVWYEDQACSTEIWSNGIVDGVRGCIASGKCAMGVRSVFSASGIKEYGYAMLFQDG
jgi:hypothetical protein